MLKKVAFGLAGLIVVAALGLFLYLKFVVWPETKKLTDLKPRTLDAEAIKSGLRSSKFSEKVEARRQVDKLPEADRLELFQGMTKDPQASMRTMAAKELAKLSSEEASKALLELSAADTDADVRAAALGALAGTSYPKAAEYLLERLQKDGAESAQRAAAQGLDALKHEEISKPSLEKEEGWTEARPKLVEAWKAKLGVK
ncbi:MAG: HEAT repeat domain-containing protein [Planctomycetes bacterium]|nr:HEAT repeat domain-containing protein [Planctomycetota bacterium]